MRQFIEALTKTVLDIKRDIISIKKALARQHEELTYIKRNVTFLKAEWGGEDSVTDGELSDLTGLLTPNGAKDSGVDRSGAFLMVETPDTVNPLLSAVPKKSSKKKSSKKKAARKETGKADKKLMRDMVEAGKLGQKTGRGFYDWG